MPLKSEYADDVDFINESLEPLQTLLPIATTVFKDWNLHINQDKTEYVDFSLANPKPIKKKKIEPGVVYRGDEPWRTRITLGSMLCSASIIVVYWVTSHSKSLRKFG